MRGSRLETDRLVLRLWRSFHVIEKIGMNRDLAGDFAHPRVSAGHPLSRHVLYWIGNPLRR